MRLKLNLPEHLARRWSVEIIDGRVRIRKKYVPNQYDPKRLEFIRSLTEAGWGLVSNANREWYDDCEIFCHPEHDFVWRVSRLFNIRFDGWLASTYWIWGEIEAGRSSPS